MSAHNTMCSCSDCAVARTQFVAPLAPPVAELANHPSVMVAGVRLLTRTATMTEFSADDGATWYAHEQQALGRMTLTADEFAVQATGNVVRAMTLAQRMAMLRDVAHDLSLDLAPIAAHADSGAGEQYRRAVMIDHLASALWLAVN